MQATQLSRVFDSQQVGEVVGDQVGAGGEGTVYRLARRADILVKCYHPEKLAKGSKALQSKVAAMIGMKSQMAAAANDQSVCWPLVSVFDDRQQWIGYAMRSAEGIPMSSLAHPMLHRKKFPGLDRVGLVSYLIRYLDAVQALHDINVMVSDFNLNNVMCKPGTDQVTLIDCDSYQAVMQGKFFACPVGSADMTPPEHHGVDFSKVRRTLQSEYFSLAIVLFRCLMLGRHPYDIVGGSDPVQNLRSGQFAYGIGNKGVPNGPWYNIWSHMPYQLKNLFIGAFTEGSTCPDKRPSLQVWRDSLALYRREMAKGWHETAFVPNAPKVAKHNGASGGEPP